MLLTDNLLGSNGQGKLRVLEIVGLAKTNNMPTSGYNTAKLLSIPALKIRKSCSQ
jgi:hypothetical protein